jgi:hypothetical protein
MTAADNFRNPDDPQKLYDQWLFCLSKDGNMIHNPYLIQSVFQASSYVTDPCEFITRRLKNHGNAARCHRCEVDVCLLNQSQYKQYNETTFKVILSRFIKTSRNAFPPKVVVQFMLLLRHQGKFDSLLFDTPSQMVDEDFGRRSRFLKNGEKILLSAFEIDGSFPLGVWIYYFEEDDHVIHVFNGVSDCNSMLFCVKGGKWTLTIDENVHITFQSALVKYHWNFYHLPFIMKTASFLKIWFPDRFYRYLRRFLEKLWVRSEAISLPRIL